MTPAFSHLGYYNGRSLNGLEEYSVAAKACNVLNFCGMMENDMFEKIAATGAKTVRIVKPYADNGKVLDQFSFAEEAGAFGIGMDIDHFFGGADVYKALALGADAAAVGRSMMPYLEKEGAEGVAGFLNKVRDELAFIMNSTGFKRVEEIDDSMLHYTQV